MRRDLGHDGCAPRQTAFRQQRLEVAAMLTLFEFVSAATCRAGTPLLSTRPPLNSAYRAFSAVVVAADSDQCYTNPLDGYQCQLVPPVNGGQVFAMVLVILVSAVILIYVNGL